MRGRLQGFVAVGLLWGCSKEPSQTPAATAAATVLDGGFGVGQRPGEHLFLVDYRSALRSWMTPAEQARAAGVDTARTERAAVAKMALLTADRAVRVLAPLVLEARGCRQEAATLRGLAAVVDRKTAEAAAAVLEPIVRRAEPVGTEAEARPLGIEKALVWCSLAVWQVRAGQDPRGTVGGMAAAAAIHDGAARIAVVDAAIDLLQGMAAAGR